MSAKKVTVHPTTKLIKQIEELQKQNASMEVDMMVLRDLLLRTVRIVAMLENGTLPKKDR